MPTKSIDLFSYCDGELFAEDVAVRVIAEDVGTPVYVYSRAQIEQQWLAYDEAFYGRNHLVCYSVKANSNLAVLNVLARLGSGFDIVSVGELERVLQAGGDPAKVIYSGVGKTEAEMHRALEVGIHSFNVESLSELELLNQVAAGMGKRARVALRVNPDVDVETHPYIATGLKEHKFGIPMDAAVAMYRKADAMDAIEVTGVACHIGSQITSIDPYLEALERVLALAGELYDEGIQLRDIDLGGGLGITYYDETPPRPEAFVVAIMERTQVLGARHQDLSIYIEPGRSIVGNAGILLTRVLYLKQNETNFVVVDAAMNDLLRPALYDAWQEIVTVKQRQNDDAPVYDVVGPVCESGDFLGKDRRLEVNEGDYLAVLSAGAYGASMSSNYNSRQRPAEVMVDGDQYHVIRRRETYDEMTALENLLPQETQGKTQAKS